MTSDFLHIQPLGRDGWVVLIDVVWRGLVGNNYEHVLCQRLRYVFGHVPAVVGVVARFEAFDANTPTSVRTGQVEKKMQV